MDYKKNSISELEKALKQVKPENKLDFVFYILKESLNYYLIQNLFKSNELKTKLFNTSGNTESLSAFDDNFLNKVPNYASSEKSYLKMGDKPISQDNCIDYGIIQIDDSIKEDLMDQMKKHFDDCKRDKKMLQSIFSLLEDYYFTLSKTNTDDVTQETD